MERRPEIRGTEATPPTTAETAPKTAAVLTLQGHPTDEQTARGMERIPLDKTRTGPSGGA